MIADPVFGDTLAILEVLHFYLAGLCYRVYSQFEKLVALI